MSEALHAKIRNFLTEQCSAAAEGRMCVKLVLLYEQPGFRPEELRAWDRSYSPEVFTLEMLAPITSLIIEIAEAHAEAYVDGSSHRYAVRTHQYLGSRTIMSFKLPPSANDEAALDSTIRLLRQLAFAEAERHKAANEIAAQDSWEKVIDETRLFDQLVIQARAVSQLAIQERAVSQEAT